MATVSQDTSDNIVLKATIDDPTFQARVKQRFINAAISVTTEAGTVTSHTARLAFAGALFAGTVSDRLLAMLVLANATNRTNLLAAPTVQGGAILDSDIDFQVNSVLTGVAISRSW